MAFSGATAGFQAGVQANDTILAYAREVTYGVAPSGPYQRLRLTGESFRRQNTRQRPEEINPNWEASQAVTTQQAVGGTLSGALSFGSYDVLLACACSGTQNDRSVAFPQGVRIDLNAFSWSGGKVVLATIGQAIWNVLPSVGFVRLRSPVDKIDAIFPYEARGDFLDPAEGVFTTGRGLLDAGASVQCPRIVNGATFNSLTFIEQLGDETLVRTGGFVKQIQISIAQGQFATFSADLDFRDEQRVTSSPANDLLPPTDSFVLDPVKGWGSLWLDRKRVTAPIRQFQLTITRDGAGQDFAMGSVAAVGQRPGSFMVSGQIQLFFRDSTEYQKFQDDWQGAVQVLLKDKKGNGYGLTFYNASLQNPQINAGSKNSTIVATFDIEGNPRPGGGTFALSIFPA
uniref:Uncharacterized protein n=1 Tax=Asaia bogorensis TaxID=91915 RepID=A0A060QKT4_9PROT